MRSPLEHRPELIRGLGLISARWAAMETLLAELLGAIIEIPSAGEAIYYAPSGLRQRINIVDRTIRSTVARPQHVDCMLALTRRIGRLWEGRNKLVHSHYGYRIFDQIGHTDLLMEGAALLDNLETREPPTLIVGGQRDDSTVIKRSFGFFTHDGVTGEKLFSEVNPGTYANHAAALSKRIRQVRKCINAVNRNRIRMKQR